MHPIHDCKQVLLTDFFYYWVYFWTKIKLHIRGYEVKLTLANFSSRLVQRNNQALRFSCGDQKSLWCKGEQQ